MGHKVSTTRHDSGRSTKSAAAVSLAIFLSMVSASAASSSSASSCGCFISQQQRNHNYLPCSSALDATLTIAGATVPPPNSRLGIRQSQLILSSSLTLLKRQPPGTKRSQRVVRSGSGYRDKDKHTGGGGETQHRRRTDLRYAYSYNMCVDDELDSDLIIARATSDQQQNMMYKFSGNNTQPTDNNECNKNNRPPIIEATYKRGKRARMLRFLDKRFARLNLKSSSTSSATSNDKSNNKHRIDYEKRKAAWAAKYTSVSTLRKSFGTNKNRLWGDFDPTTTRRLYHTLLPRALLELRGLRDGLLSSSKDEEGIIFRGGERKKMRRRDDGSSVGGESSKDDNKIMNIIEDEEEDNNSVADSYLQQELKELAPLAYQARLAAKKYARERSRLPIRIGSMLFDGYRSWRRYGKWKSTGMTWEQIWNKYEDQVLREAMEELENNNVDSAVNNNTLFESSSANGGASVTSNVRGEDNIDDEELTARICLRILERSVATNGAIDKLFLKRLAEEDEEGGDGDESEASVVEESRKRRQLRRRRLRRQELRMKADLQAIEKKFDDDIQDLLKYSKLATKEGEERRSKRRRGAFFWKKSSDDESTVDLNEDSVVTLERGHGDDTSKVKKGVEGGVAATALVGKNSPSTSKLSVEQLATDMLPQDSEKGGQASSSPADTADDDDDAELRKLAVHEVFALRLLANTKLRLASLQVLSQLSSGTDEKISDKDDDAKQ